jgi:hypothetical protein
MPDRHAKVQWTDDEKALIAARALELRDTRIFYSPLETLRVASAILPEDRRRKVRSLIEVPWFEPLMGRLLSERAEQKNHDLVNLIVHWHKRHLEALQEAIAELREHRRLLGQLLATETRLVELGEGRSESITH